MKTYNNLYPQIYSFHNLLWAFKKAQRCKRDRPPVMKFRQNLEPNLFQLQEELIYKTYRPGEYRCFYVYDPKTRLIMAAPFRDRVVHHALCNIIAPIFEARFIHDSYACIQGRGVDAGVKRVVEFLREAERQRDKVYCLKCDVYHYFREIRHDTLRRLMYRRIRCRETRWLLDVILQSAYDHEDHGLVGIPVGILSSQLAANIYLTPFDYWIKQDQHERYYVRYMDDFVILSPDKAHLHELRRQAEAFLWDNLRLRLNHKTAVYPVMQGIDFLGYRIWPHKLLLRKRYVKHMKRMIKKLDIEYKAGRKSRDEIRQILASWHGRAEHANVPHLWEFITKQVKKNFNLNA